MIFVSKFRANDLNPSKGKQIEFNKGAVDSFFEFTKPEEDAVFDCCSLSSPSDKRTIKVHFTLSPSRGDYKVYQNTDGSDDLKDYFLNVLHLNNNNLSDYFAIKKTGATKYILYYVPNSKLASDFFRQVSSDNLFYIAKDEDIDSVIAEGGNNNTPAAQTIFYGCPGTGKSRLVKIIAEGEEREKIIWYKKATDTDKTCPRVFNPTKEEQKNLTNNIFRTTFHPDYDYSTFVGCYKPVKEVTGLDYKFVPQVFTNAYVCAIRHENDPIYLIIEEINRGNCAQIFGDLFQLLDRRDGKSEYTIKPDTELAKYLASELIPSEELTLPNNLHIYATMNTSDQSLFPMDSAFKRRWEMKYVKIDYKKKEAAFTFTVNGKDYHWLEYLPYFNDKITEASDSEDKQMGEFFIRGNMTATEFKNKVMFYLWNDVCKDLYAGKNSPQSFFFRDINGNPFKFTQLFNEPEADATEEEQKDPYKNGDLLLEGFLYYIRYGKKKSPKQVNAPEPQPEENADTEAE